MAIPNVATTLPGHHLLLAITTLFLTAAASSLPSLPRASSLDVEKHSTDVLISPNSVFSCGFHQVGDNAFTFSIWYTDYNSTVVWTANPDRPVNGRRSKVTLWRDGTMALVDGTDSSVTWATNTTSLAVSGARLLDNGNLVLDDPAGRTVWQSFDSPTDTLLPGQPITRFVKLVAGSFELYYDNDNVLRMMYNGPEISGIYWPDPARMPFQSGRSTYNDTQYGVLDASGRYIVGFEADLLPW